MGNRQFKIVNMKALLSVLLAIIMVAGMFAMLPSISQADELELVCTDADPEHAHEAECYAPAAVDLEPEDEGPAPAKAPLMMFGAPEDGTPFLEGVVIKDSLGVVVYSNIAPVIVNPLVSGRTYTIELYFADQDEAFPALYMQAETDYSYQLPAAMTATTPVSGFIADTINGNSTAVAYSIDSTGQLTLNLNEKYCKDIVIKDFTVTMEAVFAGGTSIMIPFPTGTITLVLNPPSTEGLGLAKDCSYDYDTQVITYTIDIEVSGNGVSGIILRDSMSHWATPGADQFRSTSGLPMLKMQIDNSIKYAVNGGAPTGVTPVWHQLNEYGNFDLAIPGTYNDGDVITVTYDIDLSEFTKIAPWNTHADAQGKNFLIGIVNTAEAYIGSVSPANKKADISHDTKNITETFIQKQVVSNMNNAIEFIVTIGNGREKLNGKTITDIFGTGITAYETGSLIVSLYDKGTPGKFAVPRAASPIPAYNNVSATPTLNGGAGFSWQIPDPPGQDVYFVTMTYKTEIANDTNWKYSNSVEIDFPKNPKFTYEDTIEPKNLTIAKTALLVPEERRIDYTITVNTPKEMYGNPFYIQDTFTATSPAGSVNFAGIPSISVKAKNMSTGTELPLDENVDYKTAKFDSAWYIYFKDSGDTWPTPVANTSVINNYSVWPYDHDTVMTITYSAPLDALMADGSELETKMKTVGYKNGTEKLGGYINNYGYLIWANGKGIKGAQIIIYYPIQKHGEWVAGGADIIEYRVRLDFHKLSALTEAIFTDTFDPRLELVDDTIYIGGLSYSAYPAYQCPPWPETNRPEWGVLGGAYNTIAVGATTNPAGDAFTTDLTGKVVVGSVYEVVYRMKVIDRDGLSITESMIDNTADIELNGENYSQSFSIVYGEPPAQKAISFTGNTANVDIRINPQGLKLSPDATAETYEVIDEMNVERDEHGEIIEPVTRTLAFYFSTIELEAETYPGSNVWTKLVKGVDYKLVDVSEERIELEVPDGVSLRLTYKALVKGEVNDNVTYRNTVYICGEAFSDGVEGGLKIGSIGGSAGGTGRTFFNLSKKDLDAPATPVEGARFALYVDWNYPNAHPTPPGDVDATITFGSKTFYYIGVGVTDNEGVFTFKDSDGIVRTRGNIYALVELSAPSGYITPDGADAVTFFSFEAMTPTQLAAINAPATGAVYPVQVSETVTVYNEEAASDYDITYFGLEGSSHDPTNPNPATYGAADEDIVIKNPEKTGYDFSGWTVEHDNEGIEDIPLTENHKIIAGTTGDITLTANWAAKMDIVLYFDANGGVVDAFTVTEKDVTFGQQAGTLPGIGTGAPTLQGYLFDGWSTDSGKYNMPANFTSATVVDFDPQMTVYAVWAPDPDTPYTIYHIGTDGTDYTLLETENLKAPTGQTASASTLPFLGYTYFPEYSEGTNVEVLDGTILADGSLELYVYYMADENTPYKVEHYTVNGSGVAALHSTDNKAGTTGGTATAVPKTIAGYTYASGYTAGTDKEVKSGKIDGETTLVLKLYYTPNANTAYTVFHEGTDGVNLGAEGKTGTTGASVTAAPKTVAGYTFDSGNAGNVLSGTIEGDGSLVLYVFYAPNTDTPYTVEHYTVSDRGVAALHSTDNKVGTTGTTATATPIAITGYEYKAGYSNAPDIEKISGEIEGDGSLALKLYYTVKTDIKLFFDPNGGTAGTVKEKTVTFGMAVGTLPATGASAPKRTGYTFKGWSQSGGPGNAVNFTSSFIVDFDPEKTVYAVWNIVPPPVTPPTPPTDPTPPPVKPPVTPPIVTPPVEPPVTLPVTPPMEPPAVTPPVTPAVTQPAPPAIVEEIAEDGAGFVPNSAVPTQQELLEQIKASGIPVISFAGMNIPLAGGAGMDGLIWSLLNLILAAIGALLIIATIARAIWQKKYDMDYAENGYAQEGEEEPKHLRIGWIVAMVIMGVLGVVVFILTEDMTRLMVLVDNWTIFNVIIFALAVISYKFSFKRERDRDNEYKEYEKQFQMETV